MSMPAGPQLNRTRAADRLALAHWPADQRVVIGSVAGGTGRTTVAGLIALTLAGLPYAHVHREVAIVESVPEPLSTAARRWGVGDDDHISVRRDSRVSVLPGLARTDGEPVVIVDQPGGLAAIQRSAATPSSDVTVIVTRPDSASIASTAGALVWLHDSGLVDRRRLCVVINDGIGRADRRARAASTALVLRAGAVHRLPPHPTLGPGYVLPSGRHIPTHVARAMTELCLTIHSLTRSAPMPIDPQEEYSHA